MGEEIEVLTLINTIVFPFDLMMLLTVVKKRNHFFFSIFPNNAFGSVSFSGTVALKGFYFH